MARRNSPEYILPLRFTLRVPAETPLRFSVLDFPYAKAVNAFMVRFKNIYKHQNGKDLPYDLSLPYRQLNDALLTLAPGLIQGFETVKDGDETTRRAVAFTRFDDGHAEDFPTLEQLTSLIRMWLERWAGQLAVQEIIRGDGKDAWQTLLKALDGGPETEWDHNPPAPASLAAKPEQEGALGYIALPALLTALLHGKTLTIQRKSGALEITWRRANDGGKQGLHLVSQPISYRDDYFAYRLDFSVQTQAGYTGIWIFARLSIQRYIGEGYRNDDQKREKRAISILVGHNRERYTGGWDIDTTLIRLPVEQKGKTWGWASGVGSLLDDFAVRRLEMPETILRQPRRYGRYGSAVDSDEYYVVYAEGRKFGDERSRGHQIKTGVNLRERSQIIEGVLALLDGWLEVSAPFQKDTQNPANTFALRNYDYMVKKNKTTPTKQASWRTALEVSLANSDTSHLHLVVLHQTPQFCQWAQTQINQALMGADSGVTPLVTVTFEPLPPLLYARLDPGDFDPKTYFLPRDKKPEGWMAKWTEKMGESYGKKRDEWREFLHSLNWQPNARRLLLIDSTGERSEAFPDDQKIKGAVRDACHRENVLSQFIVGEKLKRDKKSGDNRLDRGSAAKLQNAVLDLLVRQQGILYAPPHEIYERAALLDAETAKQLDVIAFCRVERTKPHQFNYVLAVRLSASGEVNVMLPSDTTRWIPYDIAAHTLGMIYSGKRSDLAKRKLVADLKLESEQMRKFAQDVLTQRLERPTIAVIEADRWRNRGANRQKDCWTQLANSNLFRNRNELRFDDQHPYQRAAPTLDNLLGVVRVRMNDETPQYVTAGQWNAEEPICDIPHLTGYVDLEVRELLHYFSVARLPKMQKKQNEPDVAEAYRSDVRANPYKDIAIKHAQLIEMVPFFVHPRYQSDEGQRQLCRCVHFLRNSPGFTSGDIVLPYPMHLGEKLIRDQLVIIGVDV